MKPTLQELIAYCTRYQESIFVRACVKGKWGTYALADIPFSVAITHILRWLGEDRSLPARLLEPGEREI